MVNLVWEAYFKLWELRIGISSSLQGSRNTPSQKESSADQQAEDRPGKARNRKGA